MSQDDVLFGYRLQLFDYAARSSVSEACRVRLSLVAGYAAPYEPPREPEPTRHVEASRPGQLVGFDCFYVGRLSGSILAARSNRVRPTAIPPHIPS